MQQIFDMNQHSVRLRKGGAGWRHIVQHESALIKGGEELGSNPLVQEIAANQNAPGKNQDHGAMRESMRQYPLIASN